MKHSLKLVAVAGVLVVPLGSCAPVADTYREIRVLRGSDVKETDYFGFSVAISAGTAIVGTVSQDSGAAYVYERNQGGEGHWGEVAKLVGSDVPVGSAFGWSVAISGDTAIVGAMFYEELAGEALVQAGAAYVYERNQGGPDNWGEVAKLTESDLQVGDQFGRSVAISGDIAIVGAADHDGRPGGALSQAGVAYVYERNQGGPDNWGEVAKWTASDAQAGDRFGWSVAISGDIAIVGAAWRDEGSVDPLVRAGATYVYERNRDGAGNWGEVAKLTASDARRGDVFGWSVAISGHIAIVGASDKDGGADDSLGDAGAAYVYERNQGGAGNWGEVAKLTASDAQVEDEFGWKVAISDTTAIVGATWADGGAGDPLPDGGAAYVYERNQGGAGNWGEVASLPASDAQLNDRLGWSVAISGDTVIVGSNPEVGGTGAAYVYERHSRPAAGEGLAMSKSERSEPAVLQGTVALMLASNWMALPVRSMRRWGHWGPVGVYLTGLA